MASVSTGAATGLRDLWAGIAAAPAATFTPYYWARMAPAVGTGKTAGRFAMFSDATCNLEVKGASDTRAAAVVTVAIGLFAPIAGVGSESDSDAALLVEAMEQFWATLLAAHRQYTVGSQKYRADTSYHCTRGMTRGLPWAAGREHYTLEALIDVETW